MCINIFALEIYTVFIRLYLKVKPGFYYGAQCSPSPVCRYRQSHGKVFETYCCGLCLLSQLKITLSVPLALQNVQYIKSTEIWDIISPGCKYTQALISLWQKTTALQKWRLFANSGHLACKL